MSYNNDKTWAELASDAGQMARQEIDTIDRGLHFYNEWISFQAGRTNAEIATVLGRTETEVAELAACFAGFKTAHDAMNNIAITQGDHYFALRKFS